MPANRQEYDELKVLLPEEREITNVLQGLQNTAGESRLIVMRFSPREDSQQEFIMAKPVEIEVDSNFNNLRTFFDKMAKLQRIVSITRFQIKPIGQTNRQPHTARTIYADGILRRAGRIGECRCSGKTGRTCSERSRTCRRSTACTARAKSARAAGRTVKPPNYFEYSYSRENSNDE